MNVLQTVQYVFIYEIISFVTFIFNIIEHITKNLATSFYVFLFFTVSETLNSSSLILADIRSNFLFMSLIESTVVSIDFNLPSIDDTSRNNIFKITGVLVLRSSLESKIF